MNEVYQNKNYQMDKEERISGFRVHRKVYIGVSLLLITLNLIFVPEFIWFIFPVIGMGLGLGLHYFLAIVKGV